MFFHTGWKINVYFQSSDGLQMHTTNGAAQLSKLAMALQLAPVRVYCIGSY